MPVSSSSVMNMTPLARPGRWRTSTRPAASSQRPSRGAHGLGAGDDPPARAGPRAGRRPDAGAASGRHGGSPRPPRRRRSSAAARRPARRPPARSRASRAEAAAKSGSGSSRKRLDRPERLAPGEAEARAGRRRPRRAGPARHCGTAARRQRSSTEAKGWSARAATIAAASALARPRTMRRPSRTAKRPSSPVGSSVQSQREALTQTGRTSTPCSRASRTICAGA